MGPAPLLTTLCLLFVSPPTDAGTEHRLDTLSDQVEGFAALINKTNFDLVHIKERLSEVDQLSQQVNGTAVDFQRTLNFVNGVSAVVGRRLTAAEKGLHRLDTALSSLNQLGRQRRHSMGRDAAGVRAEVTSRGGAEVASRGGPTMERPAAAAGPAGRPPPALRLRRWRGQMAARLQGLKRKLEPLEGLDKKLDPLETRLQGLEKKLDPLETRLQGLEMGRKYDTGLETRLESGLEVLERRLEDRLEDRLEKRLRLRLAPPQERLGRRSHNGIGSS